MSDPNTRSDNKKDTNDISVPPNFIRYIIDEDMRTGKYSGVAWLPDSRRNPTAIFTSAMPNPSA